MNYRGVWPTKSAVRKVRDECESVKDALMSAGSAEQTIRAFTGPAALGRRYPGGVSSSAPMQPQGVSQKQVPLPPQFARPRPPRPHVRHHLRQPHLFRALCAGSSPTCAAGNSTRSCSPSAYPPMVTRPRLCRRRASRVLRDRALGFRYHRVRLTDTTSSRWDVCASPRVRARRWRTLALGCRRAVNEADGGDRSAAIPRPGGAKGVPLRHAAQTAGHVHGLGNGPDRTRGAGAIVR